MRGLDLYCGAGEMVGVDSARQPRYPYEFLRLDAIKALELLDLSSFDFIHASPPCQLYSQMSSCRPGLAETYPDLIGPTREALQATGLPWVIENVPGAPLRPDIILCGCQFGLRSPRGFGVRRPRWFETSMQMTLMVPPHDHTEPALPVTGHSPGQKWRERWAHIEAPGIDERREAMEITWMNREEASEAIPPAFTEFIGHALAEHLARAV